MAGGKIVRGVGGDGSGGIGCVSRVGRTVEIAKVFAE